MIARASSARSPPCWSRMPQPVQIDLVSDFGAVFGSGERHWKSACHRESAGRQDRWAGIAQLVTSSSGNASTQSRNACPVTPSSCRGELQGSKTSPARTISILPSSVRSRSAPSGSIPSKRPLTTSFTAEWTVSGVPMGCARASHAWASRDGSLLRHSSSRRAKPAASKGAKASGEILPDSDAQGRSGSSGADAKLTPKPMTTSLPPLSRRIPASLLPSRSTSLGHLRIIGCEVAATSIASISARPATSERVCGCGSPGRKLTTVLP